MQHCSVENESEAFISSSNTALGSFCTTDQTTTRGAEPVHGSLLRVFSPLEKLCSLELSLQLAS